MSQSAAISIVSVEEMRPASPYRRILVPIDGSELSMAAADEAIELAASTGAAIVFLTVNEPFHLLTTSTDMIEATREEYERQAGAHAERILETAGDAAAKAGVPFITVRKWSEDPFTAIIDVAQERSCELIAMGSHGRRGVSALVLGSVTNKVLTHSALPVLVIRRKDGTPGQRRTGAQEASFVGAGIP